MIIPMFPLHVGTKVKCRYRGGDTVFSGRVAAVNHACGSDSSTTYDVNYDDGDFEHGVVREMLWLKPRKGVLGRLRSKVKKALKLKPDSRNKFSANGVHTKNLSVMGAAGVSNC